MIRLSRTGVLGPWSRSSHIRLRQSGKLIAARCNVTTVSQHERARRLAVWQDNVTNAMPDFYHPEARDHPGADIGRYAARTFLAVSSAGPDPPRLAGLPPAVRRQCRQAGQLRLLAAGGRAGLRTGLSAAASRVPRAVVHRRGPGLHRPGPGIPRTAGPSGAALAGGRRHVPGPAE